jgi:hypothetical protein
LLPFGQDILIAGSVALDNTLRQHDLVDVYQLADLSCCAGERNALERLDADENI